MCIKSWFYTHILPKKSFFQTNMCISAQKKYIVQKKSYDEYGGSRYNYNTVPLPSVSERLQHVSVMCSVWYVSFCSNDII